MRKLAAAALPIPLAMGCDTRRMGFPWRGREVIPRRLRKQMTDAADKGFRAAWITGYKQGKDDLIDRQIKWRERLERLAAQQVEAK